MPTSASSQVSHGRKRSRSVLCSAVWMDHLLLPLFLFLFFLLFLPWLALCHLLDPCVLPESDPAAQPWLALSPSSFLSPQNKARCQQQWLWHDLAELTEVCSPPCPASFHVGGSCCPGCARARKLTACISANGNGLDMTLEMHGCSVICTISVFNSLQNGQCNWKTEGGTWVIIME